MQASLVALESYTTVTLNGRLDDQKSQGGRSKYHLKFLYFSLLKCIAFFWSFVLVIWTCDCEWNWLEDVVRKKCLHYEQLMKGAIFKVHINCAQVVNFEDYCTMLLASFDVT